MNLVAKANCIIPLRFVCLLLCGIAWRRNQRNRFPVRRDGVVANIEFTTPILWFPGSEQLAVLLRLQGKLLRLPPCIDIRNSRGPDPPSCRKNAAEPSGNQAALY